MTIHELDERTAHRLREAARREGTSMNRLVKRLLREALGVDSSSEDHRADFRPFLGSWSEQQADAFERTIGEMRQVDPEDGR